MDNKLNNNDNFSYSELERETGFSNRNISTAENQAGEHYRSKSNVDVNENLLSSLKDKIEEYTRDSDYQEGRKEKNRIVEMLGLNCLPQDSKWGARDSLRTSLGKSDNIEDVAKILNKGNEMYRYDKIKSSNSLIDYNSNVKTINNYLEKNGIRGAENLTNKEIRSALKTNTLSRSGNNSVAINPEMASVLKEKMHLNSLKSTANIAERDRNKLKSIKNWTKETLKDADAAAGYRMAKTSINAVKKASQAGYSLTKTGIKAGVNLGFIAGAKTVSATSLKNKVSEKVLTYKVKRIKDVDINTTKAVNLREKLDVTKSKLKISEGKIGKIKAVRESANTKLNKVLDKPIKSAAKAGLKAGVNLGYMAGTGVMLTSIGGKKLKEKILSKKLGNIKEINRFTTRTANLKERLDKTKNKLGASREKMSKLTSIRSKANSKIGNMWSENRAAEKFKKRMDRKASSKRFQKSELRKQTKLSKLDSKYEKKFQKWADKKSSLYKKNGKLKKGKRLDSKKFQKKAAKFNKKFNKKRRGRNLKLRSVAASPFKLFNLKNKATIAVKKTTIKLLLAFLGVPMLLACLMTACMSIFGGGSPYVSVNLEDALVNLEKEELYKAYIESLDWENPNSIKYIDYEWTEMPYPLNPDYTISQYIYEELHKKYIAYTNNIIKATPNDKYSSYGIPNEWVKHLSRSLGDITDFEIINNDGSLAGYNISTSTQKYTSHESYIKLTQADTSLNLLGDTSVTIKAPSGYYNNEASPITVFSEERLLKADSNKISQVILYADLDGKPDANNIINISTAIRDKDGRNVKFEELVTAIILSAQLTYGGYEDVDLYIGYCLEAFDKLMGNATISVSSLYRVDENRKIYFKWNDKTYIANTKNEITDITIRFSDISIEKIANLMEIEYSGAAKEAHDYYFVAYGLSRISDGMFKPIDNE